MKKIIIFAFCTAIYCTKDNACFASSIVVRYNVSPFVAVNDSKKSAKTVFLYLLLLRRYRVLPCSGAANHLKHIKYSARFLLVVIAHRVLLQYVAAHKVTPNANVTQHMAGQNVNVRFQNVKVSKRKIKLKG
jgi:hypothetical protein